MIGVYVFYRCKYDPPNHFIQYKDEMEYSNIPDLMEDILELLSDTCNGTKPIIYKIMLYNLDDKDTLKEYCHTIGDENGICFFTVQENT